MTPLHRNRDFLLLQTGQLASSLGTRSSSLACSLLVLALTHSAVLAGVTAFVRMVGVLLAAIPAGLVADRVNRRGVMLAADAVRLVSAGALCALLLAGHVSVWAVLVLALVDGAGGATFGAAEPGALRSVVPPEQIPAAASARTGRSAMVSLGGPPLGGALFGLARALPFGFDAATYAFSSLVLSLLRTPFQEARPEDPASLRVQIREGLDFLWQQPFLRVSTLLFGLSGFVGAGLTLAVVVIGRQQGLSGTATGLLLAVFGGGLLVGSVLSPLLRRLPSRVVLLLEFWAWLGCAAFLVWPQAEVLVAGMLPVALVIPASDGVVHGSRIAMTPDRLLGRTESVRSTISLVLAALGPLVAGLLLGVSARAAVAVFVAAALLLAVWGTASRALRESVSPPPAPLRPS